METEALRTLTREAAATMPQPAKAKIWPNGIGFNYYGWEYCYSEQGNLWYATNKTRDPRRSGKGATPQEAKTNARPVL